MLHITEIQITMKNEISTFDSKIFDAIDTRLGIHGRNKRPLFIDDPQNANHFVVALPPPEKAIAGRVALCFQGRELFDYLPEIKERFNEDENLFPIEKVATEIINYQKTGVEEFISRATQEDAPNGFDHSNFLTRSANFLVSSCIQFIALKNHFAILCNGINMKGEFSRPEMKTISLEEYVSKQIVANRDVLSTPEKTGDSILQLFDFIRRPATEKTITINVLFRIFDELECFSTWRSYKEESGFAREDLQLLNILCLQFIMQLSSILEEGSAMTGAFLNIDFEVEDVLTSYLNEKIHHGRRNEI